MGQCTRSGLPVACFIVGGRLEGLLLPSPSTWQPTGIFARLWGDEHVRQDSRFHFASTANVTFPNCTTTSHQPPFSEMQ